MSGPGTSGHWLDRLAEGRPTRRRFARTLLAGAALTLPFARGFPARADSCTKENPSNDPYAWRWACLVSSDKQYSSAQSNCKAIFGSGDLHLLGYLFPLGTLPFLHIPFAKADYERARACTDRAIYEQSWREQQVCQQRFQPGYSPCSPGGPCDTCSGTCCPSGRTDTGAECCTSPPEGCCKSYGCDSGITVCTGG